MPAPPQPDYLALDDDALLHQCRVETFRVSGPGGQHRNKTDTAVRLTHAPTGASALGQETRSQARNREQALRRLRRTIALQHRRPVTLDDYTPPQQLIDLVAAPKKQRIGRRHRDYPRAVQALLDLFVALDCALGATAEHIGVGTGALSRLILADPGLARTVNRLRDERGLRPLRPST